MKTVILETTIKLLMPIFLLFSLIVLFRGHNHTGGGFIGGLIGSLSLAFYTITSGTNAAKKLIKADPVVIIAIGLIIALSSGIPAILQDLPYMTSFWADVKIPFIGKPGTPLLFDTGIYILVIGVVAKITFSMAEE